MPQTASLIFDELLDVAYSLALIIFVLEALWKTGTTGFVISPVWIVVMTFVAQLFSKRLSK